MSLLIDIDSNKDVIIHLDLNNTALFNLEELSKRNKLINTQISVQHNTILELHQNSLKLAEMVIIILYE